MRTLPLLLAAALAVGCAADPPRDGADNARADSGPGDTGPGDTEDSGEITVPDGLNGAPPDAAVALPTFAARNQLGEARSESDLLGHPTVLWFYPAAGTYG